jgi:hypothetical protein
MVNLFQDNEKLYKSIYKGIVIQNDDPLQSGRVKVFVPDIHFSLIGLEKQESINNLNFGFFGKNINQLAGPRRVDLTDYIEVLKDKLPWASVLQPIVGETGFPKYNSSSKDSSVSDNNDPSSTGLEISSTQKEGPQALYKDDKNIWGDPAYSGGERVDGNSGTYDVNKPYNLPKGVFTVPSVNTQVWVEFIDGNPFSPIVIGSAPTASEWQAYANPSTYPGTYENASDLSFRNQNGGIDNQIPRQETVENSTAYTVKTNNTRGKTTRSEIHHSGTSKFTDEVGNESEYKTGDTRKTVGGSDYEDYRQTRNKHVRGNETSIVKGNSRVVIGSGNVEAAREQKRLLGNIHQYKSLFETQRTNAESPFNSPLQTKGGENKTCPACSSGRKLFTLNEDISEKLKQFSPVLFEVFNPVFGAVGEVFDFAQYLLETVLSLIPTNLLKVFSSKLTQFPKKAECNVCNGTGISPSSEGGSFPVESRKMQIPNLYKDYAGDIAKAEEQLGDGGNHIVEVTKNMVISVGTVPNDFTSVRVDKKGKAKVGDVRTGTEGTYQAEEESPVVEKVHVDNLAGGTLTLLGNNMVNLVAGAGGIKFRTLGRVDFGGAVSNLTGEQVNIGSENEVNISGGSRLSLEGKILSLKSSSGKVLVDGNLKVNGNANIKGGLNVEGELFVNHITAKEEFSLTEMTVGIKGQPSKIRKVIGYVDIGFSVLGVSIGIAEIPVYSVGSFGSLPDAESIDVYPHDHLYKTVPMKLVKGSEDLRAASSRVDSIAPVQPMGVEFSKKGSLENMFTNYVATESIERSSSYSNLEKETFTPIKLDVPTPKGGPDGGAAILQTLDNAVKNLKIDALLESGRNLIETLNLQEITQYLTPEGIAAIGADAVSQGLDTLGLGKSRISDFITSNANSAIKGALIVGRKQLDDLGITGVLNGVADANDVIQYVRNFANTREGQALGQEYQRLSETRNRMSA